MAARDRLRRGGSRLVALATASALAALVSGCCNGSDPIQWDRCVEAYEAIAVAEGDDVRVVGLRYDEKRVYVDTLWSGDAEHVQRDAYNFSMDSSRASATEQLVQIEGADGIAIGFRGAVDPPLHWGLGPPPSYNWGHARAIRRDSHHAVVLCVSAFRTRRELAGGEYSVTVMIPEDSGTLPGERVTETLVARRIAE